MLRVSGVLGMGVRCVSVRGVAVCHVAMPTVGDVGGLRLVVLHMSGGVVVVVMVVRRRVLLSGAELRVVRVHLGLGLHLGTVVHRAGVRRV